MDRNDGMSSAAQQLLSPFPDLAALTAGLNAVMNKDGSVAECVSVANRTPGRVASYPSEIVTCRTEGRGQLKLYCKYFTGMAESYGHRGGVSYESEVYRRMLGPLPVSVPRF